MYTQEYNWPTAGYPLPTFGDYTVPYPGCHTRPDYQVHADYACLPTPPGIAHGCATTAATGLQPQALSSSIPGGVAPDYCHPPLQHGTLLSSNNCSTDLRRNSTRGNDGVFQPAHSFAHTGHMQMELEPSVPSYSPIHTDVAFHQHYVGSPEQNWLESYLIVPAHSYVVVINHYI